MVLPHIGVVSEWWPDLSDRQKQLFRMINPPGAPHAADHHFGNVRARCTSRLTTVHNDDAATHNCRDEA